MSAGQNELWGDVDRSRTIEGDPQKEQERWGILGDKGREDFGISRV